MKKKIIVLGCIMTFVLALSIFNKNDYKKKTMKDSQKSQIISLNLEQTAGAGDYKAVTQKHGQLMDMSLINIDLDAKMDQYCLGMIPKKV